MLSKGRRGNEKMNRKNKWGIKIILVLITMVVLFILGNAVTVQAADPVTAGDIDDGVDNWQEQGKTIPGYINISSNSALGYTFDGLMASSMGGSTSMVADSKISQTTVENTKSKFWIRNLTSDNEVGSWPIFYLNDIVTNTPSSDFGIVFSSADSHDTDLESILNGMTGKRYFVGSDKDGNQAQKVIGNYSRKDYSGVVHNFELEIVERPVEGKIGTVSQELYLKNIETNVQNYGIFYGGDVYYGNGVNTGVIKALPNNTGLFYTAYPYFSFSPQYKINMPTNILDGPTNYTSFFYKPNGINDSSTHWFKKFSPEDFSGKGAESQNLVAGTAIRPDSSGTSNNGATYPTVTYKWPFTSIEPGETKHYNTQVQAVQTKQSNPNVTKQFQNETSSDGKNRVGDKLKFTVTAINDGFNSQWNSLSMKDVIPAGLQLDPDSMQVTSPNGAQKIPASDYDDTTKTLNFNSSINLSDSKLANFTFETTIKQSSSNKTLTNTASVSGTDAYFEGTPQISAFGSVNIPVEKSPYLFTFTKQVKNKTAGDTDFQDSTTGVYGDTVSYQIKYGVNSDSQYGLSAGQLQDKLPDGLTLVPGSISVTANGTTSSPTDLSKITLPKLAIGQTVTVNFDAKVTGTTPINIVNNATLNGTTDNNTTVTDQSNDATLKPGSWVGFMSVPDQIDFGTHENTETNFTNKSTTMGGDASKTLVVENYSTTPGYQVNVAYDNNGSNKLTDAKGDTLAPSDNQNLIFFKDITTGNWTAVTPSGTPLNSAGFSQTGLNDLTASVGAGKWRMSNRTYQPKAGTYAGTMTWQVANSVS